MQGPEKPMAKALWVDFRTVGQNSITDQNFDLGTKIRSYGPKKFGYQKS